MPGARDKPALMPDNLVARSAISKGLCVQSFSQISAMLFAVV
jgi:hypothetical protein